MRQTWSRLVEVLRQTLDWWLSELLDVYRIALAALLPRLHREIVIFIDQTGAGVFRTPATELSEFTVGGHDLAQPTTLEIPAGLQALLAYSHRARVVFDTRRVFVTTTELPIAVIPHLESTLALQYPKLLPMSAAQLLIDHAVTSIDSAHRRARITIAALRRDTWEPYAKTLDAWGIHIVALQTADSPTADRAFNFHSRLRRSSFRSDSNRIDRWLIGGAVALGMACVATAATQSYRSERALSLATTAAQEGSKDALLRRAQLNDKIEPLRALMQVEKSPTLGALLGELSAQIPHDAWVTTLEIKDNRLRLVGISGDPQFLVKLLNGSTLLHDVELKSSMSAGIGTGKDRFEVTADLASP